MPTRTQTAHYIAEKLQDSKPETRLKILNEVAAWLRSTRRTKEVKYLSLDVAKALAETSGYFFVRISTARQLDKTAQANVISSLKAKLRANQLEAVFYVDPSLIGGIKIELPDGMLDNSVKRSLAKLVENIG